MSFVNAFIKSFISSVATYLIIAILITLGFSLGWSILKTVLNPFHHNPNFQEIEKNILFRDKIVNFKKENRFRFVTFKFILKVEFSSLRCFFLYGSATP